MAAADLDSDVELDRKANELDEAAKQLRERASKVDAERDNLQVSIKEVVRKLNEVAELTKR
jgi:uncharacterized coiled-coil DUF342 family protein